MRRTRLYAGLTAFLLASTLAPRIDITDVNPASLIGTPAEARRAADGARRFFNDVGRRIRRGFQDFGKKVKKGFDDFGKKVKKGFDDAGRKIKAGFEWMGGKIREGAKKVGQFFKDGMKKVKSFFEGDQKDMSAEYAKLDALKKRATLAINASIGRWRNDPRFRTLWQTLAGPKGAPMSRVRKPAKGDSLALVKALTGRRLAPSGDPTPSFKLAGRPTLITYSPAAPDQHKEPPKREDTGLASRRKAALQRRDAFALDKERLAQKPTQFCYRGQCAGTYAQVAQAIYGPGQSSLPVFCAPRKQGGRWSRTTYDCSSNWLSTLGAWKPWKSNGEPSRAPEDGVIPPSACFGSPHVTGKHMILPAGGSAGSGFQCRRRVFRILAKQAETSLAAKEANIRKMCVELRQQTWAEKFPNVERDYREWCVKKYGPSKCEKPFNPGEGQAGSELLKQPFMLLSREELLYFYGHKELYCRADRKGLTHFLYNREWADSFTCGISRGVLEAGPFEEGVQACALSPFLGATAQTGKIKPQDMKARLHCWQFSRPTCEDVSRDQTLDDLSRSNVFDEYDAFREFRRTHDKRVWGLKDLKDAENVKGYQDEYQYSDASKDEGAFGVNDFCRFVGGSQSELQCGFDRQTMAQWYELRRGDKPQGCEAGICSAGAYQRGYYCGLFQSKDYYAGKKLSWVCGIDSGAAGLKLISRARAVCVGGALAERFHSPKGNRHGLQCFERRFYWGESERSVAQLKGFQWKDALQKAAQIDPRYDPWLAGGLQAYDRLIAQFDQNAKRSKDFLAKLGGRKTANQKRWEAERNDLQKHRTRWESSETFRAYTAQSQIDLMALVRKDASELVAWMSRFGHTLGHRTAARIAIMEQSGLKVVKDFLAMKGVFKPVPGQFCFTPHGGGPSLCAGDKDNHAVDEPKAKALNELIQEVIDGAAADGKWYQAFRLEATEQGRLRVQPQHLLNVFRIHHAFRILDAARLVLLNRAREYAGLVMLKREGPYSRLELMEHAARSGYSPSHVFCVNDPASSEETGGEEFVCGASPLFVAGAIEQRVKEKLGKNPAEASGGPAGKVRGHVELGWCYGGLRGKTAAPPTEAPVLSVASLAAPFMMEVPPTVAGQAAASPARGARGVAKSVKSSRAWLRCSGMQYSDENWADADPKLDAERRKQENAMVAKHKGKTDGFVEKLLEFIGTLVKSVMGNFKPLQAVANVLNASMEWLDKWAARIAEMGQKQWEDDQKAVEEAQKALDDGLKDRDEKKDKWQEAEKQYAAADPAAKEGMEKQRQEAKKTWEDAKLTGEQLKTKLAEAKKKALENTTVKGTGELLGEMLDDLSNIVAGRVMDAVEPHARALLNKGFRYVRKITDVIAKSLLQLVASIPFVGGTLARLASELYSWGMDKLEDLAFDALRGLVERLMAKLTRALISPVFKAVQGKLLQLVAGMCKIKFRDACPKEMKFAALPPRHQWIERALACPNSMPDFRKLEAEAVAARIEMIRKGKAMERNVRMYAKQLANQYFARYGMTVDEWVAAVGTNPTTALVAKAARIQADLELEIEKVRSEKKRLLP